MRTGHDGFTFYDVEVGIHKFTVYAPVSSPEEAIMAVRDWEDEDNIKDGPVYPYEGFSDDDFDVTEYNRKAFCDRDVFPETAEIQITYSELL